MTGTIELPDTDYGTMRITEPLLERLKWDMARTALTGDPKTNIISLSVLLDEPATRLVLETRRVAARHEMQASCNDAVTRSAHKVVHQLMNALLDPLSDAALATLRSYCTVFIRDYNGGGEQVTIFEQRLDAYIKALKITSHYQRGFRNLSALP